jgi:tRNA (Thr-GGU) A37 N-methylase
MPGFDVEPVAWVRNARTEPLDDDWDAIVSDVELADGIPDDCLTGLDAFSHVEIVFLFDRVRDDEIVWTARHPRNNPAWPRVGMLAQRGKNRPNRLGVTVAQLVSLAGRVLTVRGLDAVDGTPVLDIKPVMREFLPRGEVRQPAWASELMRDYWVRSR